MLFFLLTLTYGFCLKADRTASTSSLEGLLDLSGAGTVNIVTADSVPALCRNWAPKKWWGAIRERARAARGGIGGGGDGWLKSSDVPSSDSPLKRNRGLWLSWILEKPLCEFSVLLTKSVLRFSNRIFPFLSSCTMVGPYKLHKWSLNWPFYVNI